MLEPESSCFYFSVCIKNNVEGVLLATYTIFLTASTVDFNLSKKFHLIIKWQQTCFIRSTVIGPYTSVDKVFKWTNPRINWSNNCVVKLS